MCAESLLELNGQKCALRFQCVFIKSSVGPSTILCHAIKVNCAFCLYIKIKMVYLDRRTTVFCLELTPIMRWCTLRC